MLRTVAASLLAIAAAGAADDFEEFYLEEGLPFVDIRLGYGFVPRADEFQVHGTAPITDYTYMVKDDTAQALTYGIVGGSMNPLGLIGGAELVYSWDSLDTTHVNGVPVAGPTATCRYQSFGGNVLLGVGLALSSNVHLEVLGLAGLASIDMDTSDVTAANQDSGGGWSWTAGVRGGAYFTWRRLVLGVAAEWTTTELKVESNWDPGNSRIEETVSGVGGRIEIGYHIQ